MPRTSTLSVRGHNNPDGSFNWPDAIIDAGIMAFLTFFTTLAGISIAGLMQSPAQGFMAAGIAAGVQFFTILAIKRGLIKQGG